MVRQLLEIFNDLRWAHQVASQWAKKKQSLIMVISHSHSLSNYLSLHRQVLLVPVAAY